MDGFTEIILLNKEIPLDLQSINLKHKNDLKEYIITITFAYFKLKLCS